MAKEAPTRERMEEAEARSEEKHDRPPEPASDAVLTVSRPAGKIVDANAAAAEMLGYSLPELIGLLVPREIIAPEVLEQTQREWLSQMRETGHYCVETVWVRKDGSRIPVKASGKPITLAGQPLLHVIAHDIRERKEAEEAVKESEERLKLLFEFAPDAYYLNDLRGIFVDGNAATEEITGYKREELIGKNFLTLKLLSPEEVPKAAATLAKNVAGQPTGPDEFTLNRKDGSQVTVEIRTFPVRINSQTLALGIARDITERKQTEAALRKAHDELEIRVQERTAELTSVNERLQLELTERKQAEEALRESEERFRHMFEAAFEGIAIHENGVILDANPAFERMFGYPLSEVIGKSVLDLAAEESRGLIIDKLRSPPGEPYYDAVGLKKDGTPLSVEIIGRELVHKGRRVRVTAVRDVTERKRMEEALQAARDELEGKVERQLLRRNPYRLTFRELTVLHLVAVGESDKQIGLKLGISYFTAQKHTSNILAKMGAGSRTEAVVRALREGMLD